MWKLWSAIWLVFWTGCILPVLAVRPLSSVGSEPSAIPTSSSLYQRPDVQYFNRILDKTVGDMLDHINGGHLEKGYAVFQQNIMKLSELMNDRIKSFWSPRAFRDLRQIEKYIRDSNMVEDQNQWSNDITRRWDHERFSLMNQHYGRSLQGVWPEVKPLAKGLIIGGSFIIWLSVLSLQICLIKHINLSKWFVAGFVLARAMVVGFVLLLALPDPAYAIGFVTMYTVIDALVSFLSMNLKEPLRKIENVIPRAQRSSIDINRPDLDSQQAAGRPVPNPSVTREMTTLSDDPEVDKQSDEVYSQNSFVSLDLNAPSIYYDARNDQLDITPVEENHGRYIPKHSK